jgi:uncharacterized protein
MPAITPPTSQQRLAVRLRPEQSPVMFMRWEQLLFLHWSCEPAEVQRTLPPGLTVDTFNDRAWLGIVPFFMRDVRPIGIPALPFGSDFLELNVRTYVYDDRGVPGVWFYSLDCNQPLAVEGARGFFHLNYQHAEMDATIDPATRQVSYRARRRGTEREARFSYRAVGESRRAAAESLDFFLVERYVLFAYDNARQRLGAGRVSHEPYDICAAEVDECDDVMLQINGFPPRGTGPEHVCATEAKEVAACRLVFE